MAAPVVRTGELRTLVQIVRPTHTQDEYGDSIVEDIPVANAWAAIMPLSFSSQETTILAAAQFQQEVTHQVIMHYRDDLNTGDKLVNGTREFEIVSIADMDNRHARMELLCRERR